MSKSKLKVVLDECFSALTVYDQEKAIANLPTNDKPYLRQYILSLIFKIDALSHLQRALEIPNPTLEQIAWIEEEYRSLDKDIDTMMLEIEKRDSQPLRKALESIRKNYLDNQTS